MKPYLVTLGPCDKGWKKQEGRRVSLETPFPLCLLKASCIPWTLPVHPRASFVLHRQLFHGVTVFTLFKDNLSFYSFKHLRHRDGSPGKGTCWASLMIRIHCPNPHEDRSRETTMLSSDPDMFFPGTHMPTYTHITCTLKDTSIDNV